MEMTIGGRSLHYEVLGSGSPVLLVHGFPLSSELWDPIVSPLEWEYRLIVPDLRGHGQSEASPTVTMAEYVEDLITLLDRIEEARPVVLVGMSMGGYIAFEFWRRHPERIRALVLANTRAQADDPEGARARRELARRAKREGSGAVAESMLPRLFGPRASRQLRDRWRRIMAAADPVGIVAALGAMEKRPDSFSTLAAVTCPVLIVAGEEDALTPLEGAQQMQRVAPHSRLEVIPGSGHMSPVENPERFLDVLRGFLDEIRSPDDA